MGGGLGRRAGEQVGNGLASLGGNLLGGMDFLRQGIEGAGQSVEHSAYDVREGMNSLGAGIEGAGQHVGQGVSSFGHSAERGAEDLHGGMRSMSKGLKDVGFHGEESARHLSNGFQSMAGSVQGFGWHIHGSSSNLSHGLQSLGQSHQEAARVATEGLQEGARSVAQSFTLFSMAIVFAVQVCERIAKRSMELLTWLGFLVLCIALAPNQPFAMLTLCSSVAGTYYVTLSFGHGAGLNMQRHARALQHAFRPSIQNPEVHTPQEHRPACAVQEHQRGETVQDQERASSNDRSGHVEAAVRTTVRSELAHPCGSSVKCQCEPQAAGKLTLLDELHAGGLIKPSAESRAKPPALFQLNMRQTFQDDTKQLRRFECGKSSDKPSRTLMFLGATGAGKTTSLNALVNHVLGVKWSDSFRLLLIDETGTKENQAHSQTKWVTAYVLHWQPSFTVPYTLVLVETPGFGDTSGIQRDKQITDQLRGFFQDAIPTLDAIGFVIQSSLPRLTPSQSYVYESVLSLFGKDISDNILVMATFADAGQAKVKSALKEAKIPYRKLLKLNNSALFAENSGACAGGHDSDSEGDEANADFNEMFWNMGSKSFQNFFKELETMTPNGLASTRAVLKNRKDIEDHIVCINSGIQRGLSTADCLRQEIQMMQKYAAEISANKNFTYTVTQCRTVKHDLAIGVHVTNCLNCNLTCHYNCAFADDSQKACCVAMDSSGHCKICPAKCHWQMHKNMRYYFDTEQETVTKTTDDLKQKYEAAKKKKLSQSEVVEAMLEEWELCGVVWFHVMFFDD